MSNKMPRAAAAKTALARSWKLLIVALAVGLLAVILLTAGNHPGKLGTMRIGAKSFEYETASTESARELGLSGRASLPGDHVMLFVFSDDSQHCFWMKDMKFPLDMVWLDSDKNVVFIKENAQPDSYPQTFCPDKPSRYVIEADAGTARAVNLHTGEPVSF